MKTIKVQWLSAESDCELCGPSWAEGAEIFMPDGETILLKPVAHCFDLETHDRFDVVKKILNILGYELEEMNEHLA